MADSTQTPSVMQVSLPEAGETVEYRFSPDIPVKFNFFVSEVLFSCDGDDLILTGNGGGTVIIKDYQSMAQAGMLPTFELNGGEEVPGDIYMFAFNDGGLDIETAAGTPEEMAGEGAFTDEVSPGNLLDGDTPASETLGIDEVLSGADQISMDGASRLNFEDDMTMPSLADSFDPVDDAIQQIIDSPDIT